MTELFVKDSEISFPEILQYTYKRKNEYQSGLDGKNRAYNKSMKSNIIFLKNGYTNYQEVEQYFKRIAKKFNEIQIDEKKLGGMPVINNTSGSLQVSNDL